MIDLTTPGPAESDWAILLRDVAPLELPEAQPPARPRLVVVSPHPDDETLGAGGLIHDLWSRGWRITVVSVTDGEASHPPWSELLRIIRPRELRRSLDILTDGEAEVIRLGVPDGSIERCQQRLRAALQPLVVDATLVATTWSEDGHPDHVATAVAVHAVAVGQVIEFPIWAWHQHEMLDAGALPRSRMRGWSLSVRTRRRKSRAIDTFRTQRTAWLGQQILPDRVAARFERPMELVIV